MIPKPTPWQSNEQTGQPIFKPGNYLLNPNEGIVGGSSGSGSGGWSGGMGGQDIEDQVLRISAECQKYLEGSPTLADCQRRLEEAVALRDKVRNGEAGTPVAGAPAAGNAGTPAPGGAPGAAGAAGAATAAGAPAGGTTAGAPSSGDSRCDSLLATLERLTVMYRALPQGSPAAGRVWERMLEVHNQMNMCARDAERQGRHRELTGQRDREADRALESEHQRFLNWFLSTHPGASSRDAEAAWNGGRPDNELLRDYEGYKRESARNARNPPQKPGAPEAGPPMPYSERASDEAPMPYSERGPSEDDIRAQEDSNWTCLSAALSLGLISREQFGAIQDGSTPMPPNICDVVNQAMGGGAPRGGSNPNEPAPPPMLDRNPPPAPSSDNWPGPPFI